MLKRLGTFRRDQRGATSIEYVLIAGFLSVLIVVGVTRIGTNLKVRYFQPVTQNLT